MQFVGVSLLSLIYVILGTRELRDFQTVDNSVTTSGELFSLEISSAKYNLTRIELELALQEDPLIFGDEESLFVVSPPGASVKARGYIEEGKFYGQFSLRDKTFFVDHPQPSEEGGILYELADTEGKCVPADNRSVSEKFPLDTGKVGKLIRAEEVDDGGRVQAQTGRTQTQGNVCRMRIIVDKFLLDTFDNNKQRLMYAVKIHEETLNDLYKANSVTIKVNRRSMPIQFKVVELLFHDEEYCRNNGMSVGCVVWGPDQDAHMLEQHARSDHSDVCLAFIFTSHNFAATLGTSQSFLSPHVTLSHCISITNKSIDCFIYPMCDGRDGLHRLLL